MSVDVSVVVPVYNTELYLNQCVDSLLAQTLKNVEFIFVDDGSTDRSVEILKEYQQKDPRITILQQKNQFAGVARNNGMKAATGKYIIFVDSDDFFEPTMLEEAFNCAEANQAEIVAFDFYRYNNVTKESRPRKQVRLPEGVFSVEQAGKSFFMDVYPAPWNKLFLRSFVESNGLQFQAIKKFNDNFFILTSACLAKRIVYLDRWLLFYRINNSTSLQGNNLLKKETYIDSIAGIKQELKNRGRFSDACRDAYDSFVCYSLRVYLGRSEKNPEVLRNNYEIIKQHLVPDLLDSPEECESSAVTKRLARSVSLEDYLLLQIGERKDESS